MNIIGIRGHRGAGKATISYLLAQAIEFYLTHGDTPASWELFRVEFEKWCHEITSIPDESCDQRISTADALGSLNCHHVIIEGFGDGPKMMLSMLTGIDMKMMNSDYMKDHMVVNLKDFSSEIYDDVSELNLYNADDYYLYVAGEPAKIVEYDTYMTLRELIIFFGLHVMQGAFGANVWVKSLVANKRFYEGVFDGEKMYKIFADVKSVTEASYIKNNNGVIIKVSRPNHEKTGGLDLLKGDSRYDFEVVIDGPLEDLVTDIKEIALCIISK